MREDYSKTDVIYDIETQLSSMMDFVGPDDLAALEVETKVLLSQIQFARRRWGK